ncbi:ArdC-like ssDNA-binding domain-containing protein [Flavobacterium denitrificans]|uniref:ArdC-like ssDNA-binding domain-containing protein n=1 Tax=Flavobacterium denitrificans TaxID=281361 RepID=UPI00041B6CDD|nr:ArdC-like ssDNA-binding domain-containing protein [Flavobacterium denitrificans]
MTDKKAEHIEKKKSLIALSKVAKEIQAMEDEPRNINSILIEDFYSKDQHREFNTFQEWIKKGFRVQKGEKAFLVWGRKRKSNQDQAEPKTEEEKEFSFYPLCYLFSNAQVQKVDVKN